MDGAKAYPDVCKDYQGSHYPEQHPNGFPETAGMLGLLNCFTVIAVLGVFPFLFTG